MPEFPSAFLSSLGTLSNTRGMGILLCSGSPEALPAHRKGSSLSLSPNAPLNSFTPAVLTSVLHPVPLRGLMSQPLPLSFWQEHTFHIPGTSRLPGSSCLLPTSAASRPPNPSLAITPPTCVSSICHVTAMPPSKIRVPCGPRLWSAQAPRIDSDLVLLGARLKVTKSNR